MMRAPAKWFSGKWTVGPSFFTARHPSEALTVASFSCQRRQFPLLALSHRRPERSMMPQPSAAIHALQRASGPVPPG